MGQAEVLRWHLGTQLATAEMKESGLLFLTITGGYRSPSVLNKPVEDVGRLIGLSKGFTQRGLRRTFNDLARAAQVEGVVTKSISGHLTERMRERYSTVAPIEQRASIARVIDFAQAKPVANSGDAVPSNEEHAPSGSKLGARPWRWGAPRKNRLVLAI